MVTPFNRSQELYKDDPKDKYEWTHKGDTYTLKINNPTTKDAGRYNLVVKIEKDAYLCGGMLEVSGKYCEVSI